MKARVRATTVRNRGRAMKTVFAELRGYLKGWKEYFRLADTRSIVAELDQWIRHRLRTLQLKRWKRGKTVFKELRARGVEGVPRLAT
jgi:RNA-directed DNA polymerase